MGVKFVDGFENIPKEITVRMNDANPFFLKSNPTYYDSIGKKEVYFYDDERIMPIVINKKVMLNYGYLPTEPWYYKEPGIKKGEGDFLNEVMKECRGGVLHLDWIGQTPPSALFLEAPSDSISIPFGSYIIDLELPEDELWANVHSKHRNVIRKSEKSGVIIEYGGKELLQEYLMAEKDTMERSGLPIGQKEIYLYLFDKFKDHVNIFLARRQDGNVQGGAIIIYSKAMGYYMHGASINAPVTGAMNHVQWEIVKYLKGLGVKKYSFVGCRINEDKNSKYYGIQNFKKRFGGELFKVRMFKVIFNPVKYKMYKKMIEIKTKGFGTEDIIDQEIYKWQ